MMKWKQRVFLCSLFFLTVLSANAQQPFSGWVGSFNTFKLNSRLSLHFDAQLRSTDGLEQVGAILLRPGLNFHLNKTFVFTAGYLLNSNRRTVSNVSSLLPEHRIWQQVLINQKISKVALAHRFRFEERFIPRAAVIDNRITQEGSDPAFRFRYFIRGLLPLTAGPSFSAGPFLALQNEVFLNTGNKTAVNGKSFDQNRLYGAVGYRFPGKMDVEVGYMNQYSNTRTSFINNHILQLAVYKRL